MYGFYFITPADVSESVLINVVTPFKSFPQRDVERFLLIERVSSALDVSSDTLKVRVMLLSINREPSRLPPASVLSVSGSAHSDGEPVVMITALSGRHFPQLQYSCPCRHGYSVIMLPSSLMLS